MPMNAIIREKRKALGLTQEEVADALGVTAPAVNKWEKGATAPDIALLPPLARLLGVDLNALFCFFEGPSKQEIDRFAAALGDTFHKGGLEAGFAKALAETRKYPNCAPLLHTVAMTLDGALLMLGASASQKQEYSDQVIALYEQAVRCGGGTLRDRSRFLLAGKYLNRGEFGKAQELLASLPEHDQPDKRQLEAQLLLQQGKIRRKPAGLAAKKAGPVPHTHPAPKQKQDADEPADHAHDRFHSFPPSGSILRPGTARAAAPAFFAFSISAPKASRSFPCQTLSS